MKKVLEGLGDDSPLVLGCGSRLIGRAWVVAVQAFFVGMLVLPTSFQLERGIALAALTGIAAILALRNWRVHYEVLFLWCATTAVGVFGIAWGVFNDAPGALRVSTVYLLWPALYLLFIGLARNLQVMRRLESALLIGVSLATAMCLIVLGAGLLGLGDAIYPLLDFQDAGFGEHEGFVAFRIFNLSTVMYGFPFVVSLLMSKRREIYGATKVWCWVLLMLISVVAVGSARRAFWLVVMMAPLLSILFLQLSAQRFNVAAALGAVVKIVIAASVVAVVCIMEFDLDPAALVERFGAAFSGQEESSGLRYEQAGALWRAFESSPLIGIGLGSSVEVIRSEEQPWAYELAYLSLLKSVGLLGFLVYAAAIVWIVIKGMVMARRDEEFAAMFVPIVVALICFLVMNATNPYLEKFDYLWVVFLPVALINARLTGRSNK